MNFLRNTLGSPNSNSNNSNNSNNNLGNTFNGFSRLSINGDNDNGDKKSNLELVEFDPYGRSSSLEDNSNNNAITTTTTSTSTSTTTTTSPNNVKSQKQYNPFTEEDEEIEIQNLPIDQNQRTPLITQQQSIDDMFESIDLFSDHQPNPNEFEQLFLHGNRSTDLQMKAAASSPSPSSTSTTTSSSQPKINNDNRNNNNNIRNNDIKNNNNDSLDPLERNHNDSNNSNRNNNVNPFDFDITNVNDMNNNDEISPIHITIPKLEKKDLIAPLKYDSDTLDMFINNLKLTTMLHQETQTEKAINENAIRTLYKQLWMIVDEPSTVSDHCPDGQLCSQTFRSQVSQLNSQAAKQLEAFLKQNHFYNTTQFIGSLFQQTLNELRLAVGIYSNIAAHGSNSAAVVARQLSRLAIAYRDSKPPQAVINILLHLYSRLVELLANTPPAIVSKYANIPDREATIVDIDFYDEVKSIGGSGAVNNGENILQEEETDDIEIGYKTLVTLNREITFNFNEDFLSWGHIMIHPTFEDIFQRGWLLKLFHVDDLLAGRANSIHYLQEDIYVNLLLQLDFSNFSNLINYRHLNIQEKVLFPLQKGLELSIQLKMTKLALTIGKIVCLIGFYFPAEIDRCITLLFKTIWPSQLISCTLLPTFNWSGMSQPCLTSLFLDIYQLTILPQEYSKMTETNKYNSRYQFIHTLFSYQYIINGIYELDSAVSAANINGLKFPQLLALRRIAQCSSTNVSTLLLDGGTIFHLSRLILDEMFFFAFIFKAPASLNPVMFQTFRSELYTHIFVLLQTMPHLVNRFMYNISQHLLYIDLESYTSFIEPHSNSPLYFWDMSGDGISWLGFVLCQRLLPIIDDVDFCNQHHAIIQQFVVDPPQYEIAQSHMQHASSIVFKILLNVNWEKVTPLSKMKTILILIGARKYLGNNWIAFFINHSRILLSKDLNKPMLKTILSINPRNIYHWNDNNMFLYIQIMLGLNLSLSDPSNLQQNLFEQLGKVRSLPQSNFEMMSSILCYLVYILRDRIGEYDRELLVLYQNITQNRQQYSTNLNVLLSFIKPWFTQPLDYHSPLLQHWIHLLTLNMQDEENMTILNNLACGSYLKNYGTDIPLQLETVVANFNSSSIKKLVLRRPWIGYFIAITYTKYKRFKVKETLQFFRELASELKGDAMSLLFWEYFWMIYFDSLISQQIDPLSQDIKNDIYQCVYTIKGPMVPPVRRAYETFTTWNRESILPNGRIISADIPELWKIFTSSALWIFNKNEDKIFYEANQRNWLNSLSQDINSSVLVKQLLIPKKDIESYNAEEKKYQNFEDIFNDAAQSILRSTIVESIKIFNDLKLYLGHSKRLSQNILDDDKVFLELSQNLHTTKSTRNNAVLKCSNPNCLGVTVQVETKISQPNVQSSSMIKENRKSFNEHFYNLFERVYQLAVLTLILEDKRLHDLYFQKEDLFALLVHISSEHSESITETVINTLGEVAYRIGKDILEKDPSNQTFLLNTFLPQGLVSEYAPKTDYSLFVRLFSPSLVNDMTKYLDYLEQSLTSPRISAQQKRDIFESFKIEQKIQQIIHMGGGKERLIQLIPTIVEANTIEPTAIIINALLFIDSNHLINITMLLVRNFASAELIERIYGKSKQFYEFVKSIKPEQQNLIIQTLVEKISEVKSPSSLFLLSHLVFYEFLSKQFIQSLLTKIRLIYIQSIRPNDRNVLLSDSEFLLTICFFVDLIKLAPRSINMAWEVFFYGYIPLLDKYRKTEEPKKNKHVQELVEMMGNFVAEGHLEAATFHIQPNDILEQMCNVICQTEYGEIVVALFSILDWSLLKEMPKIPDHVGLHYLKLCIYISILNGSSLMAPDLGLALGSDNAIDWYKCGDLADATVIFDGLALTNIITCSSLKRNPTAQIIEALTLMKDTTLFLDNYNLAMAFALELRALLYFTALSQSSKYWYIPHQQQLHLVQNLLLPLIRSLAENKDAKDQEQAGIQQRMKNILKITMSCLDYDPKSKPINCKSLTFATDLYQQDTLSKDLNNKVQNLILNFCSTLSINLCLQIMPVTHIALTGSHFCLVIEAVLHSLLSVDTLQISTLINKYLVFTDAETVITKSIQNNCPITLYIVILQQLQQKTLDHYQILDLISNVSYQNNREYELWIIWILVIKLIRTNEIDLKNKAILQKINTIKSWIQSFFGTTNPIASLFSKNKSILPQTHLASRACYIFLIRSIIQQQGKSKDDENLLNSTIEGLLELKKKSKDYQSFDAFFNQVDNFLSPIVEVDDFSQILIQTLVPFAGYLSNLLKYEP